MSEPKWTPGPWEIARYENHEGFSVWAKGSGCIAERWWPTRERDIPIGANAHLIAAAPDLYEALRKVQWGNAEFDVGTEYTFDLCPMCDQSEVRGHAPDCLVGSALAKARGEA